ncbi:hypothetical protein RJJ65_25855 [Rhizobium hidalgonense]|uniref:Uncharacterized protein n=1 Tax=Rhizobium hidalgonense TaxID=1538159 RepID=A0A2A6K8R7_9HYPH|nr:hypothetical protein [Rhizobium hidalgonense]MDR9776024.1 hypothetical protein [Rhizobium hidalgonense]MDR9814085.1 hypothetical protein [Rhizobium hidalgonense]MDR9820831.1 hypothetical protein [Rhizobium hidalgonense]PDT20948.1 hypothetical protein CO674_24965 [Rhizobium hidalgonense]PON07181.1 hypothetical protein ATY29_12655 [Rhizobium hidalgonense]
MTNNPNAKTVASRGVARQRAFGYGVRSRFDGSQANVRHDMPQCASNLIGGSRWPLLNRSSKSHFVRC